MVASVLLLVISVIFSPSALARSTCSENNSEHCYAEWVYFTSVPQRLGNVSGHLHFIEAAAVQGTRTNLEAWINTASANDFSNWIEQGMKVGEGPDGNFYGGGIWFWEDHRPNVDTTGHVNFHPYPNLTVQGDVSWGFHYHGGNTWYLQRGDVGNYGTSTYSPGPTIAVEVGAEFTNTGNTFCGYQNSLAYQVSGTTTQHFGLTPGSISYIQDAGATVNTNSNVSMKYVHNYSC